MIKNQMMGAATDFIENIIMELQEAIREAEREIAGLNVVLEQAEEGLVYFKETGRTVMYISSKFSRITTLAFGVFLLIVPMGLVAMRF